MPGRKAWFPPGGFPSSFCAPKTPSAGREKENVAGRGTPWGLRGVNAAPAQVGGRLVWDPCLRDLSTEPESSDTGCIGMGGKSGGMLPGVEESGLPSTGSLACGPTSLFLSKRSPRSELTRRAAFAARGRRDFSQASWTGGCACRFQRQTPSPCHAQCGGAGACTRAPTTHSAGPPPPCTAPAIRSRPGSVRSLRCWPALPGVGPPAHSPPGVLMCSVKTGRESPGYEHILLRVRTWHGTSSLNAGCASRRGHREQGEEEEGPDPWPLTARSPARG